MKSRQAKALDKHENELRRRLTSSANPLLAILFAKKVISQAERDEIDATTIFTDKLTKLLKNLKSKENAFSALIAFLRDNDGNDFAKTLEEEAHENGQSSNGRKRTLWEVPPPCLFFTGRETLIDQLLKSLEPSLDLSLQNQVESKTTVLSACHGLGGVGKTQLAIEFVHRHKDKYYGVFWFSAENSSQIEIAYKKLAKELEIDTQQLIDDTVSEIKAWFSAHPGCLLIYDNASDMDVLEEYIPKNGCHALLTSRNATKWYRKGQAIAVDGFEVNEATDYIKKILVDEVGNQKFQELANRLGCLPLALSQACAYIKDREETISDYLRLYEKEKEKRLSEETLLKTEHEPVFHTSNITINAIQIKSQFAANLLKICSYFHSDEIPYFLLRRVTENEKINPKKQSFEEGRGLLRIYSMIKVNNTNQTISLHRILQDVMRLQHEKENNSNFFREAQFAALEVFPSGDSLADYAKATSLIPHLERILHHLNQGSTDMLLSDSFEENIFSFTKHNAESRDKFSLELQILDNLSHAVNNSRDTKHAHVYCQRALVIRENIYGPDDPEVATTLNNLGLAYGNVGDYKKQREYLERSLVIREKIYGPDHPKVGTTLNNLGLAYGNVGDYKKQREYFERSLAIAEKIYGPDHRKVERILNNLGRAYRNVKDCTKQREYLERALAITEKIYGPDHPELGTALNDLGLAYGDLKDYTKQREYLERALAITDKIYGPDHAEVGTILNNLGLAYGDVKDCTKQCEYLERALAITEKIYGPDHPEVGTILNNLGRAYGDVKDYTKQREYLERALAITEKIYGPDHPEVGTILNNLGRAYGDVKDYTKQREYLERALAITEKIYGPDHAEVGTILNNLGLAYRNVRDYTKQREFFERALAIAEKRYGPDHPEVGTILNHLGRAYGDVKDYTKQCEYLERALAIAEKIYGPDHPKVERILNNLGRAYRNVRDYTKQCEHLERALAIEKKHYGPDHPNVETTLSNLGHELGKLGGCMKQREYFDKTSSDC